MVGLSHGLRPKMITMLLRSTRKQSRIFIPLLVIKVVVGGQLEQLGVLHSTERVEMVTAAPLLMMMRLRIIELSTGRERAMTEAQILIAQMMSKRLRRMKRNL